MVFFIINLQHNDKIERGLCLMNQNVKKLLEVLEANPILLNKISKATDIESLYRKAIKIVGGYTINDLKFALEELEIIPHDDALSYVSGGSGEENIFEPLLLNYDCEVISN